MDLNQALNNGTVPLSVQPHPVLFLARTAGHPQSVYKEVKFKLRNSFPDSSDIITQILYS